MRHAQRGVYSKDLFSVTISPKCKVIEFTMKPRKKTADPYSGAEMKNCPFCFISDLNSVSINKEVESSHWKN